MNPGVGKDEEKGRLSVMDSIAFKLIPSGYERILATTNTSSYALTSQFIKSCPDFGILSPTNA